MDGETEPMDWTGYKLPEGATEIMIVVTRDGTILARYMFGGILCQSMIQDGDGKSLHDAAHPELSLLSVKRANLSDFLKGTA